MSPTPRFFPGLRDWYDGRDANRYVQEAVRNTLGNEEKNFSQQLSKINKFKSDFINKRLASNPKILREHRISQIASGKPEYGRILTSRAYRDFMKESQRLANRATRTRFKKELAALDKYNVRRNKFVKSMEDKYAATDPSYARYLDGQRRREQSGLNAQRHFRETWEKWAKQNDPSKYKKYLRDKKRLVNPKQTEISSAFYTDPSLDAIFYQPFGIKQKLFDQQIAANQLKSPKPPKVPKAPTLGPVKSTVQKIKPPIYGSMNWGDYTPVKRKKPKYNQAAYLAGLQSAPMTMGQKMKPQQGIYKPYANGGGVRKPKYNTKG